MSGGLKRSQEALEALEAWRGEPLDTEALVSPIHNVSCKVWQQRCAPSRPPGSGAVAFAGSSPVWRWPLVCSGWRWEAGFSVVRVRCQDSSRRRRPRCGFRAFRGSSAPVTQ